MIISLLSVVCIGLVVFTIIAVAQDQNIQLRNPPSVTKPAATEPNETTPPEVTTPPTESEEARIVSELIKETDFIAAGYDYQKAIQMLKQKR